jgi:hypothetical protein
MNFAQKVMIPLSFTANGRLLLDALPKGSKSNQDDFIDNLLPALNQARTGNAHHKGAPTLKVHMDNSMFYHGAKMARNMSLKGLGQRLHPSYSPDTSPCDFWAFGTIKEMIKD